MIECVWLTQYEMKPMRTFSSICNRGVSEASRRGASMVACKGFFEVLDFSEVLRLVIVFLPIHSLMPKKLGTSEPRRNPNAGPHEEREKIRERKFLGFNLGH